MQDGEDYESSGRWEALFQLGTEKIMTKNALAKVVDEKRDAEEASKHSFRPEINKSNIENEAGGHVEERLGVWGRQVEEKKQRMIDDYLAAVDEEELKDVTFKPYLIAEEKLKERETQGVEMDLNYESLEKFYNRMNYAKLKK